MPRRDDDLPRADTTTLADACLTLDRTPTPENIIEACAAILTRAADRREILPSTEDFA